MDAASGDNIALRGNGVILANWFNKGAFQMYGNYDVDEGSYNITIQNIISVASSSSRVLPSPSVATPLQRRSISRPAIRSTVCRSPTSSWDSRSSETTSASTV